MAGKRRWLLAAALAVALVVVPQLALLPEAVTGALSASARLWRDALPTYISDTFWLTILTALVTVVLGLPTAWLVSQYDFGGRKVLAVLLGLPLAVPGYISAYTYTELFGDAGLFQSYLRQLLGVSETSGIGTIEIRSLPGAAVVMGVVLYPYVYITCRASFISNSGTIYAVARSLGANASRVFWRVVIPSARPALAVGIALVSMETLHDIGTVQYFGVQTLTLGVYVEWLHLGSLANAALLAVLLQFVVVAVISTERITRGPRRYSNDLGNVSANSTIALRGKRAWLAAIVCAVPVLLGLVIPLGVLLREMYGVYLHQTDELVPSLGEAIWNSASLALTVVILLTVLSVLVAFAVRIMPHPLVKTLARISASGYAMPGVVMALGMLIALRAVEEHVGYFLGGGGLWLTGTVFALAMGYTARFMAVTYGSIESGYSRIPISMDMAAQTLGGKYSSLLGRVHLPLLLPALLASSLLALVDCIKELPITLLLRPFGYENLATTTYTYASIGRFDLAAAPALAIVIVGLLPMLLLDGLLRRLPAIKK